MRAGFEPRGLAATTLEVKINGLSPNAVYFAALWALCCLAGSLLRVLHRALSVRLFLLQSPVSVHPQAAACARAPPPQKPQSRTVASQLPRLATAASNNTKSPHRPATTTTLCTH